MCRKSLWDVQFSVQFKELEVLKLPQRFLLKTGLESYLDSCSATKSPQICDRTENLFTSHVSSQPDRALWEFPRISEISRGQKCRSDGDFYTLQELFSHTKCNFREICKSAAIRDILSRYIMNATVFHPWNQEILDSQGDFLLSTLKIAAYSLPQNFLFFFSQEKQHIN